MFALFNFICQKIEKIKLKCIEIHRIRYWKKRIKSKLTSDNLLSKKQFQEIKKNYKKYTTKVNKIFFDFYYQKTGVYSVNFIPHDIYYTKIDPFYNCWEEAKYFDNKCYYEYIFPNIKQPKTLYKRMNNIWYDSISNIVDIEEIFDNLKNKKYFLKKSVESEGGLGVFYITNITDLKEKIKRIYSDIIIQEPIIQSNVLTKLNPSSVNTIRILSLLSNKGVNVYSSVLRMGINNSKVDNASGGGITCGIMDDGSLKSVAYDLNGNKFYCHPNTLLKFSDVKIPNYNIIISKIKEIALNIPHFRLVSWDIALDNENNPVLIEANMSYGGLDFHQLNNGPLFGNDTDKILKEVFSKKRKK